MVFNHDGPNEDDTIGEPGFDDTLTPSAMGSEQQDASKDSDLCDCDPKYKDTRTVQRTKGGTIGSIGGNIGDGTTVIVCRNCGGRFYEDEQGGFGNPFGL